MSEHTDIEAWLAGIEGSLIGWELVADRTVARAPDVRRLIATVREQAVEITDLLRAQELRAGAVRKANKRAAELEAALRWYLADDERSVEQGILEDVDKRPANAALAQDAKPQGVE